MNRPYSEATVELVAEATEQHHIAYGQTDAMGNDACVCGQWWDAAGDNPGWDQHMAEVALDALAKAGLLLPEGVETRTEWAWAHDNLAERCLHTVPCEEDARKTASYFDGIHLMRRQVQIGPWESVDAVRLAEGDTKPTQDHGKES